VSLRVENGALAIQNGFTHYPQKREINRYFRGDVALPERIILLDGSGSISFDVLSWLAEQKVSFIRIDWKGDIVCVAGASGYSANVHRVRWQLETRESPEQRNEYCGSIITRKIEASIITLEKSIPRSDKWERAMKSAYTALSRLEENPPETIIELRALEANCAASYFRSWVGMPIKWRGTSRRPVPENWHFIGQRSVALPFRACGFLMESGFPHRSSSDSRCASGGLAMTRPYWEDLRERAVARFEAGETIRSIGKAFGVDPRLACRNG
jgi:CRISP-associated protein Cas1